MKIVRFCMLLVPLLVWPSSHALAQSNAHPDYKHQHKAAQKYQKNLQKQHNKQAQAEAKQAQAYRKQHH